jgi:hypothetical protein
MAFHYDGAAAKAASTTGAGYAHSAFDREMNNDGSE